MTGTFTLYRFYAADDRLLYVGLSINPGRRMEKHRATQPWWREVARIEMEQHADLQQLRAAEREAIEAEKPLYNVRMNGVQAPRSITWPCDVCREPVEDGDGWLTLDQGEIQPYIDAEAAWERRIAAEYNPDGKSLVAYPVTELSDFPERVRWHVFHRCCDPDLDSPDDYTIEIERIRTHAAALHWTAHLMDKNWLDKTSWADVITRAAGPYE